MCFLNLSDVALFLTDCNCTRTHNQLVRKQTLNYFAKLIKLRRTYRLFLMFVLVNKTFFIVRDDLKFKETLQYITSMILAPLGSLCLLYVYFSIPKGQFVYCRNIGRGNLNSVTWYPTGSDWHCFNDDCLVYEEFENCVVTFNLKKQ